MRAALVVALCVFVAINASAQMRAETDRVETPNTERHEARSAWGLTEAEWREYESIMEGKRGNWSPHLDPISALGVSTDSAEERRHFAELYVRAEFERVRKELAFQLAVDDAWKRLYPSTPRFDRGRARAAAAATPQRYAIVVSQNCSDCDELISKELGDYVARAVDGVDIHVVGTGGDDAVLRGWVSRHAAVEAGLREGSVTVNHADDFKDISKFPAIWRKAEGQWARER